MRLRIHPAGIVMWTVGFLFFPSYLVLAAACALAWHEAAHILVMYLCGIKTCSIEITPFGGMADVRDYHHLAPVKQAVCAIAGVLGSITGMFICIRLMPKSLFWNALGEMHFSLALFNCLPLWPLDGARTLVSLASAYGGANSMQRILCWLGVLCGALLTALGLYGAWIGEINFSLLLSGPYLCYAACQGYVSEKMRNICFPKRKLDSNFLVPVKIYASNTFLPKMIGKFSQDRYHLLFEIDDQGLTKIWTEDEMLQESFQNKNSGKSCK